MRCAAVAVALVGALPGCGGTASPTPGVFAARADAVCAAALRAERSAAGLATGAYAASVAPIVSGEAARLRALRRPAAGWRAAAPFRRLLGDLDREVSALHSLSTAARAGDTEREAAAVGELVATSAPGDAASAGLRTCAQPEATVR